MAGHYDITIEQDITYSQVFIWRDENRAPIDLTGMEARGVIRTRDGDLIAQLACAVNGTTGEIVVGLPHTVTATLDFDTAIYDIDIYQDDVPIKRLLKGSVTLCRDVEDE